MNTTKPPTITMQVERLVSRATSDVEAKMLCAGFIVGVTLIAAHLEYGLDTGATYEECVANLQEMIACELTPPGGGRPQ